VWRWGAPGLPLRPMFLFSPGLYGGIEKKFSYKRAAAPCERVREFAGSVRQTGGRDERVAGPASLSAAQSPGGGSNAGMPVRYWPRTKVWMS
jgi:hypothetical protein